MTFRLIRQLALVFATTAVLLTAFAQTALANSNEYSTPGTWLEGFKPNYFLYGNPDSKIQVSAKAQLFESRRLYFAYSQTMFWRIAETSSPMSDVDFNPEIFYRIELHGPQKDSNTKDPEPAPDDVAEGPKSWIDVGLFEHESNGQSGLTSRSWNRSYVRYVNESRYENDVRVYFSAKVWIPYATSSKNGDILDYRGIYELQLTVANLLGQSFGRNDMTLRLYPGGVSSVNPFEGGQELTIRFARKGQIQFVPLWSMQLFNGTGESLLDYKNRRTILRAGLSF